MAYKLQELKRKTDKELEEEHDAITGQYHAGINYYLDEIHRRETSQQTEDIRTMTRSIQRCTLIIAFLTIVVTLASIITLLATAFSWHY